MPCPAAHEKCGRAEAAAGSGAQGSTASPAGEAGGGAAIAAGTWGVTGLFFLSEWTPAPCFLWRCAWGR